MKKIILALLCITVSCCFLGCTGNSIDFKRDSKFSEMIKSLQLPTNEPKVKRSSGVMIYKDQPQEKKQNTSQGFGPSDLNFDLKVKF